jgi:hypothetical protein
MDDQQETTKAMDSSDVDARNSKSRYSIKRNRDIDSQKNQHMEPQPLSHVARHTHTIHVTVQYCAASAARADVPKVLAHVKLPQRQRLPL